jgi:hypothetical protein
MFIFRLSCVTPSFFITSLSLFSTSSRDFFVYFLFCITYQKTNCLELLEALFVVFRLSACIKRDVIPAQGKIIV